MTDLIRREDALQAIHDALVVNPARDEARKLAGYVVRALPAVQPDAVQEAARVLLADLALALETHGSADGLAAGRRWSKAHDAAEAAPTAMSRPTPIQMIRAALEAIATEGQQP